MSCNGSNYVLTFINYPRKLITCLANCEDVEKVYRQYFLENLYSALNLHPIVALLGPRQCGKTTLARQYREKYYLGQYPSENYFDLERQQDLARLQDAELALSKLSGLVIIDEIQRCPELFPTLRVLVDSPNFKAKFLILGSSSRQLIQQSSESLAGRIQYIELTPFNASEIKHNIESTYELWNIESLWVRGGFPRSFLADNDELSFQWREAYIRTFLEQDIPNLGIKISPVNLARFWQMLTHYHGNIINYSELGRSLNLNHSTVKHYIDLLQGTFMIRQLQPWHVNIGKRQIKSPKIYFRDSGLLHALMNINCLSDLKINYKLGASWEGWAIEEIIRYHGYRSEECYFWATQKQAELDLLLIRGQNKIAFECKYTSAPKITKSMHIAIEDLQLKYLIIIYPGEISFPLSEQVWVSSIKDYLSGNHKNQL